MDAGLPVKRGTRHWKVYAPGGGLAAVLPHRCGAHPNSRQTKNVVAALRRHGVDL